MDYLWPLDIIPGSQSWGVIDPAGVFTSPLSGTTRTVARAGSRLKCSISIPPVKGQDRARILGFLSSLRKSDRAWIPDYSVTSRGALSAPELLTNGDFSNGTTGWTGNFATLSVTDRVLRLTAAQGGVAISLQQAPTLAAYTPYALRGFHSRSSSFATAGPYLQDSAGVGGSSYSSTQGMGTKTIVSTASGAGVAYPVVGATGSSLAGDVVDLRYASLAQCALVDNGPNALQRSDEFGNAYWATTEASVTSNSVTAPDGSATGDYLVPSTNNTAHYVATASPITVASAAADYSFSVACIRTYNFVRLQISESTSGTVVYIVFNLLTGAVGSTSSTGANWSNLRAAIRPLGGNWYECNITARKTNAATSITPYIIVQNADNASAFTGDGTTGIGIWRATLAQSSVPVRLTQTVSAAPTGASQTGSSLYVKGLPASTAGLLRVGDPVQIGTQINFVSAPLDSDAAGRGLLQCSLPWRVSPADSDPVIIHQPMAKMILASDINWDTGPGQFSPFELEFVEDVS